jgi:hypothetical protein
VTRIIWGLALGLGLSACGGTPPFGGATEGDPDSSTNSAYLTEANGNLVVNNIAYDPNSDTLTINNIPFDDPDNRYERITTEKFSNGFNAYQSAPAPGSNEVQYFAVFRRSDSGASQVAAAGTDQYVEFGFGGAGAQRLGARPNLPTSGIYSYSGEYAAVRTSRSAEGVEDGIQYVTGDARFRADFGDFDEGGAVSGEIGNRQLYNTDGQRIGALDGYLSLANGTIDLDNATINASSVSELRNITGSGNEVTASGTWQGVFAGPGGREIAGILFVEGSGIRETGGLIATCTGTNCP